MFSEEVVNPGQKCRKYKQVVATNPRKIIVVINWDEELKQKVPVN